MSFKGAFTCCFQEALVGLFNAVPVCCLLVIEIPLAAKVVVWGKSFLEVDISIIDGRIYSQVFLMDGCQES